MRAMPKRCLPAAAATASLILVLVMSASAQQVALECKYVAGQRLLMSGTMTVQGTVTMEGLPPQTATGVKSPVSIDQKVSFEAVQSVEQVDADGVATITTKFRFMRSESMTSGQHVVTTIDETGMKVVIDGRTIVDTSRPGAAARDHQEAAQQLVEQLVKDTVTVTVRKDGSVVEVSGGTAQAMLGQASTPGQWSRMGYISLPKEPVTVGSTWEASQDLAAMLGMPEGKGTLRSTCRLESIEPTATDRLAHIDQDVDVKLADWSSQLPGSAMGMDASSHAPEMEFSELTVTGLIRTTFAIEAGRMVESEMDFNQHIKAQVGPDTTSTGIPAGPGPASMVTDMHLVGTVTTNLIEEETNPDPSG